MSDLDPIINGFPHTSLPPILGVPTYATIAAMHLKLNANSASIQSNLGDGQLGLLALTIPTEKYNTLSQIPFLTPTNPGVNPTFADGATQFQIAATQTKHKEDIRVWREYNATDKALKQQILSAVNEMYYKTLRNRTTG